MGRKGRQRPNLPAFNGENVEQEGSSAPATPKAVSEENLSSNPPQESALPTSKPKFNNKPKHKNVLNLPKVKQRPSVLPAFENDGQIQDTDVRGNLQEEITKSPISPKVVDSNERIEQVVATEKIEPIGRYDSDDILSPNIRHRASVSSQPLYADAEIEVEDDFVHEKIPNATVFASIINISNTILGSGMLAMPSAVASVGLVFGLLMIGFSGAAAAYSLWLLTDCARHVGRTSSFFTVSKITYPNAAIYFDLAIAIKCFGVATSYLIVIGDLMPEVVAGFGGDISEGSLLGHRRFWITAFMSIIIPLSFLKKLNSLRYTSSVALGAVAYLVFIVLYFFFDRSYNIVPGEVVLFRFSSKFFTSLPIFVFAFTCHQNIFTVFNEMADNSEGKVNRVINVSISAALIVYYIVGTLGYTMYGDTVSANIIQMYPVIPLVTIGRFALVVLFVFSYPLQAHPCRASLDKVISHFYQPTVTSPTRIERAPLLDASSSARASPVDQLYNSVDNIANPKDEEVGIIGTSGKFESGWFGHGRKNNVKFVAMTVGILIASYTIAFFVSSLDKVLAIVGSTGSTTICYILPGLFYYKIHENDRWDAKKIGAVAVMMWGISVMVVCLSVQFISGVVEAAT